MKTSSLTLILLSIGLFYTFTSPQYESMKEKNLLAKEYRNAIKNVSSIAETRDKLLVNYEAIPKAEIDQLSKVLPDNVDTVRFALDLDNIASRYGIAVKNVKVDTGHQGGISALIIPSQAAPYEKVSISFSVISNYQNFMRLLADLERSMRIMDIKSASFRTSESGLYEFSLLVDTYWLK